MTDTFDRSDRPSTSRRHFLVGLSTAVGAAAAATGPARAMALDKPSFPPASRFDAEVPMAWFDLALALVRTTPGFTPPVAARAFGYAGVALYEAVVPSMAGYRSLQGQLTGLSGLPGAADRVKLHWPTVANSALAGILRRLFPTTPAENAAAIDTLEESLGERFLRQLPRSVSPRSAERGEAVAEAIFEWSTDDGGHEGFLRNFPADYDPPAGRGLWQPTPPAFQRALQPSWGANRTFAIGDGTACMPDDPTPYSEDPSSAFFAEALQVYETVNRLTDEQRAIALFWADDPVVTATPPGHSISITTQVLRQVGAALDTVAETYARVGMAVADAFIACWHTKYRYNLLRPVTYIQAFIDSKWVPPLVTPPFPEYTSGHSVQSGAAAQVLGDLFGHRYAFVDRTHEERGLAPRTFESFFHAAREAAISRMYGGIHYLLAIVAGLEQGVCVGQAVSALDFHEDPRGRRGRRRRK
jgi:PAP2 superfamily